MAKSTVHVVLATLFVGSSGFLATSALAAVPAAAEPFSYGCGDEGHDDDDKDESFKLCGDEGHDDDDKDESFKLCGDEGHDDDDKDESFKLCGDEGHDDDDKDESFRR